MIIDDNAVLFDYIEVKGAAVNSKFVALTSLYAPGQMAEAVYMSCFISEDFVGGTSLTVEIQNSIDGINWLDTHSSQTLALADLKAGKHFNFRQLASDVDKPYIRLVATPTGTFTAGKLFASINREDHLPYTEALKIKG